MICFENVSSQNLHLSSDIESKMISRSNTSSNHFIVESKEVLNCTNVGSPVILLSEDTPVAGAFRDTVDRFLGEERALRFITPEPVSFFRRIFG
jgi:septum formation inhibitor-activating ATPase MinD